MALSVAGLGPGVVAGWPTQAWCARCEERICVVHRIVPYYGGARYVREQWCGCGQLATPPPGY